MKLLALDVGVITGVAQVDTDNNHFQTHTEKNMEDVWNLVRSNAWDAVICESFQATLISSYGIHTVQLIGGVKCMCWLNNLRYVSQVPQARYSRIEEAKEILRTKRQPYTKHQLDALAHLLVFLGIMNQKPLPKILEEVSDGGTQS